MTRKRVKFGLALLGLLLALFMGLLALMFVPTLASADKGPGTWEEGNGQSGNSAYFEQGDTDHAGTNGPGHSGPNPPHGDEGPCADAANPCEVADNQGDGPGHYYEDPNSGGQNSGGQNPGGQGGNGNPGGNTDSGNDPHGGQPGPFAGWLPSGGGFPGGGGEPDSCTKDDSNKSGKDTDSDKDKKTCDKDDPQQSGTSDNPSGDPSDDPNGDGPTDDTSGDFSGGFFGAAPTNNPNDPPGGGDVPDPNCFPFGDFCGPQNDDPPNTSLTDPPNEIPEPFTLSLFAVGLTGAAALRRTRRKTNGRSLAG